MLCGIVRMNTPEAGPWYCCLMRLEISDLYTVKNAIDDVEMALRELGEGAAINQPRNRVVTGNGSLQVMSGFVPGAQALGLSTIRPLDPVQALSCRSSIARRASSWQSWKRNTLGQIRTGAASGVASKVLARADASSVSVIGSGWQARTQLEAVCAVRNIERANVFSRDSERRGAFARDMSEKLGIPVTAADSGEEAVRGTDIVIVITNARTRCWRASGLSQACT